MLPGMHLFNNHNWFAHKFKSQLQSEYTTDCMGANMNSARTMAERNDSGQGAGQSAVTTKEVITWEGAGVGSSYIAEGVSPMAW